jgi:hypothetical protein
MGWENRHLYTLEPKKSKKRRDNNILGLQGLHGIQI